jgi:hypothetical protein
MKLLLKITHRLLKLHSHKIKNKRRKFNAVCLTIGPLESVAETPVSGAVIVGVYMWKSIQSAPEKKPSPD